MNLMISELRNCQNQDYLDFKIFRIIILFLILFILSSCKSWFRHFYSYLNASTGFRVAAFQLCQLTVNNAIPNANRPAKAKIHQLNSVL